MEEKLIDLLYKNNLRLIAYFLQLPNTGTGHGDNQQEEDIDIEAAINEDVLVINSVDSNNQGGQS